MTTISSTAVDEADRLAALSGYEILDTPAEPGFDDIVHLASHLCATPVSLVSLVTDERQWFKARIEFPHCETDLDSSVCAHALSRPDDILVIPDLTADPRTSGNPLVTGEPHIRFYAGAPLVTPDRQVLGTLCVIDKVTRPHGLTEAQDDGLRRLARQVVSLLELRRSLALRDKARAEEAEAYRIREVLRDTQDALATTGPDLHEVLGVVVDGAMRAIPGAEGGVVELLDGDALRYVAVRGSLAGEEGLRLPSTGSLAGHVAATRTPRRMSDAGTDPYVRQDLIERLKLRSAVVTPMRRGSSVLGVLKLQSSRADAFTDRDLDALGLFTDAATTGFAHAEAKKEVQARDAHWRGVFEHLVEGMIIGEVVRGADGRVVDWRYLDVNAAWEELVGVPRAQALGRTLREIIPGIEDEWVDEFARVVETGVSLRFQRQVGVWDRWYEGNAFRLDDDRFAVTFLNVTARVEHERRSSALLELGDRLRDIDEPSALLAVVGEVVGRTMDVDRVGYGTLAGDGDTFTVDRDWTAPGFPSLAGRYRMDDYGLYAADLRRGDTVVIDDIRHDARTASNTPALTAISVGSLVNVPVVEGGRTVAILYVNDADPRAWAEDEVAFAREVAERTRGVMERRRAEHGLRDLAASLERQVEERTRERDRLWRLARDPFVIADAGGRWTSVNPACSTILGWSAEEMIGRTSEWMEHPDDRERMRRTVLSLSGGEHLNRVEVRLRTKSGDYRWLSWAVTPADGFLFAVARDVTMDKQQAAEQGRLEDQLRQSQKMEAVGQLTGGVAHDFNNLLTVIKSSTDLLKRPNLSDERRTRYVAAISDTVDRAAKLTGQLLAFARRQALKPEVFDACDSVRALSDMMGTLTGSRIRILTDLAASPNHVDVDPSQFDTALINLAVNARDAMDGEGSITIAVKAVEGIPAVRSHPKRKGRFVAVSLGDTGTGIAAGDVERIFEPFFTTKGVGKGTGLGLSQVFGFVRQSGGDITVESTVGKGTTFTIYLPHVPVPEQTTAVEEPEALVDGHGTRVLLVEDNPDVGAFTMQSLGDLGYVAVLAVDGAAALAELAKEPDRFDVVFSDVMMPGMSGIELGQEIRRRYHDLPVLLTSGYSHVLARDGADGFELLHKPYSVEQLSQMLRKTATRQRRRRLLAR